MLALIYLKKTEPQVVFKLFLLLTMVIMVILIEDSPWSRLCATNFALFYRILAATL